MADAAPWTRSPWADAGQLAGEIDPDDIPPAAVGQPPHAWYAQLCADGVLHKAAMFLAHALPRYECVVWGAQALLDMGAIERHDPVTNAVLRWIDQPGDALRREAGERAAATRRESPARTLAEAVMFSGGSLAPAEYATVLPPEGACALMVAAALMAGAGQTGDYRARMQRALALGEAIAQGR